MGRLSRRRTLICCITSSGNAKGIASILEAFERLRRPFSREAVEAAIAQGEEITPELLRVLERTLEYVEEYPGDDQYIAHFFAMYLQAQFRERRAYQEARFSFLSPASY